MSSRSVLYAVFLMLFISTNHCSALKVSLNFRDPSPSVVSLALLLISYPIGKFPAFTLPVTTYRIPLTHLPRSIFPLTHPTTAPDRDHKITSDQKNCIKSLYKGVVRSLNNPNSNPRSTPRSRRSSSQFLPPTSYGCHCGYLTLLG